MPSTNSMLYRISLCLSLALSQISCIATSPLLANREIYRRYFQLLPPEFETAVGFYEIIAHYGWKKVGVVLEDEDLFTKVYVTLLHVIELCETYDFPSLSHTYMYMYNTNTNTHIHTNSNYTLYLNCVSIPSHTHAHRLSSISEIS